jgi:2Fe-2S ferredoxin
VDLSQFKVATTTVRCEPSGREAVVIHESNLMDAIHQTGLGLGQSCDGIALCGFCRVQVIEGADNLSPMNREEEKVLTSVHAGDDERLACCATVLGPVTVTTTYW